MAQYIIGNGGHARCLAALTGAMCINPNEEPPEGTELYVGVGLPSQRRNIFNYYVSLGYQFPRFGTTELGYGVGTQLMPGSIAMPGCTIGKDVLINTGAQIDHDCVIGDHSVIAPGAILCGNVTLGEACHIGAGAIIVQGVKLAAGTFVPAGTLVCGPTDFRRPQRVVSSQRAIKAENSAFIGDAGNV